MKCTFAVLLWTCCVAISLSAQDNQLKNPGFELQRAGWTFYGSEESNESHAGNISLKVSQTSPTWAGADQLLRLPKGASTIEIKGWIKVQNVIKGHETYELARIALEFLDEGGALTGGYPPAVVALEGTADWKQYSNTYDVPEEAVQVKLQLQLGNCTGTAYFDDLELAIKNDKGESMMAAKATGPADVGTWYTLSPDKSKTGSHYANWSSLLDAPAGKHGYVKEVNGQTVFEDGTVVKFWGANLVGPKCFPEKRVADSLALRLSKMGCNILRLHHMDAPWANPNIFGNSESTMHLSNTSLDKLDYLIAALKKKGIYVFLDLLVHRKFSQIDGVGMTQPDLGGKQVGYFDDRLIELQKQYIRQLLTHKNKYTGLAYKDEPAIAASEFINESSVYTHFTGDILNSEYRMLLQEKFEEDPANANKKLAVFDLDYSTYASPCLRQRSGDKGDVAATFAFLSKLEKKYYQVLHDYMRSLGVKYLLSGSNFPNPILAYQRDNTGMPLITTNDYWDHPQVWKINNDWDRAEYAPFNNTSILKNYQKGPINNLSKYAWKDKPLIVTEFNDCYPNEYRLEAIPYLAAYGKLQGFSGILHFHFDPEVFGTERKLNFAFNNNPDHLAQWVVAAPLFLRDDIKEAPSQVLDHVTDKQAYSLPSYSDFMDQHSFLPLVTRVAKQTAESETVSKPDAFEKFNDKIHKIITSETGELSLHHKQGIFKLNAPKVQGVVGALKDSVFDFPVMKVSVRNPWASVIAVSKDNKPLAESKHFYLVVVTPVRTKGMQYSDNRTELKEIGENVMQAQAVLGTIQLKTNGHQLKVFPLSVAGTREAEVPHTAGTLNLMNQKSFVFEVVAE